MAFTFDEVIANTPASGLGTNQAWIVNVVITRIQEDGRVSYTAGVFGVDHGKGTFERGINTADPASDGFEFFSDRGRFSGPADRLGISISRLDATRCRIERTLKSWGNRLQRVDVALPANFAATGKIYQGLGVTIARGRGQALWCMTFVDVDKVTIVMV